MDIIDIWDIVDCIILIYILMDIHIIIGSWGYLISYIL